jgi:hypothetical protein
LCAATEGIMVEKEGVWIPGFLAVFGNGVGKCLELRFPLFLKKYIFWKDIPRLAWTSYDKVSPSSGSPLPLSFLTLFETGPST